MKLLIKISLFSALVFSIIFSAYFSSLTDYEAYASLASIEKPKLLYSSLSENKAKTDNIEGVLGGLLVNHKVVNLNNNSDGYERSLFLAPNRNLIAVTAEGYGHDLGQPVTYISDVSGNQVTVPHLGSFISWLPDSSGVLVFRSEMDNEAGREIFILRIDGKYQNSKLPVGTISADVAPTGNTVYSLTRGGDNSDLFLRPVSGEDKLILKGNSETFAWLRLSPKGDKIAFMKLNIRGSAPNNRELWTINSDGTGASKLSTVVWNYPPVWSPDGSKLLFVAQENNETNSESNNYALLHSNLWEYDFSTNSLNKLTNFVGKKVLQPNYSFDGKSSFFISNESGYDEVWGIIDGKLTQLTFDKKQKRYPVIP